MNKLPLIALSALCLMTGVARAQTAPKEGVQLKNAPKVGESFRVPLDQFPNLGANRPAGTRLRANPGTFNSSLQLEIVRQDSGEALRQLADILGVRVVIDPAIVFLPARTRSFYFNQVRGDAFDYLSDSIIKDEAIEKWKSSAGTYFFAAKAVERGAVTYFQMPDGTYRRSGERLPLQEMPQFPRSFSGGPFSFGPGNNAPQIDPDFNPLKPGLSQPQPDWNKRQFNGRDFYYIPGPTRAN